MEKIIVNFSSMINVNQFLFHPIKLIINDFAFILLENSKALNAFVEFTKNEKNKSTSKHYFSERYLSKSHKKMIIYCEKDKKTSINQYKADMAENNDKI
jgi:hypothetical protein